VVPHAQDELARLLRIRGGMIRDAENGLLWPLAWLTAICISYRLIWRVALALDGLRDIWRGLRLYLGCGSGAG